MESLGKFARPDEIPLLRADGVEAHDACFVNNEHRWLLAERDHATGHVIGVEHASVGISEHRERIGVLRQMVGEFVDRVGGDGHD